MARKTSIKSTKLDSPGDLGDSKAASKIRFSATLLRPKAIAKAASWIFLTLPKEASATLPSRSMTSVEGTFNGLAFQATLEPDGQGGHWLKVDRKMLEEAGAEAGEVVTLEIAPVAEERACRIRTACDMLAKGKRRPCCFDRSGMYDKSLRCPVADDTST
ncbi:MAG: DUF1905 domain-containing protein [Planctomycetes bacterium]|nr:DUF1905 domain-containing protein [Planctomycetota bacterium]